MVPGFSVFLKLCSLRLPPAARGFWDDVSSLGLAADEAGQLARIEAVRRRLVDDKRTIRRKDFGVGSRKLPDGVDAVVQLGDFIRKASISPAWGRLLFKLGRSAGTRRVLELGACAGLSAAYLQSAVDMNGGGLLVTIEGDPALCRLARETLASVSERPGAVVQGKFSDVLESQLEKHATFDFVFLDGHHDPVAVQDYFRMIRPYLVSGALVVLDDIQPFSGGVRPAWKAIIGTTPHAWTADLLRTGVLRLV